MPERHRLGTLLMSLAAAAVATTAGAAQPAARPASQDLGFAVLTEGVVGGIVPPSVRRIIVVVPVSDAPQAAVAVAVMSASAGDGPDARGTASYRRGTLASADLEALTATLDREQLWDLPVEDPRFGEDIYRRDKTLSVRAGGRAWFNGAPAGCVRAASGRQPTDAERARFERLVAHLEALASAVASESSSAAEFDALLKRTESPPPDSAAARDPAGGG